MLHKAVRFLLQFNKHLPEISQLNNNKTGLHFNYLQYLLPKETLRESDYGKKNYACLVFELSSVVHMKDLPG